MDWTTSVADMRIDLRRLNQAIPETTRSFGELSSLVKKSGPLDAKSKEFIALGISVAIRCEPCIGFHVEALARAGGTREELCDMLGMAIQMGGGPALMYAAKALAAWDALAEKEVS